MDKIQRVSCFFKIIFQILFVLTPILHIIGWMNAPEAFSVIENTFTMSVIPSPYRDAILHTLSGEEKMLGGLVDMVPTIIDLFIIYSLIRLFRLYEVGEIFSMRNVKYIRNIGYGLLASEIVNPIYEAVLGLVLTWNNPPGHKFASITMNQTNIGMLLTALLVILVSWIMAEGCKLREEQQLTV